MENMIITTKTTMLLKLYWKKNDKATKIKEVSNLYKYKLYKISPHSNFIIFKQMVVFYRNELHIIRE
jgi:hypothetical protein